MVDIITSAHEAKPDAGKGLDARSITGGDKAAFNDFSNIVSGVMQDAQKYVASTFGTPTIVDDRSGGGVAPKEAATALGDGDFHNVSDAAAKGGAISLNGHRIDFGDGKMPPATKGSESPTVPDWPTGNPDVPINVSDLSPSDKAPPNINPLPSTKAPPDFDPRKFPGDLKAPPPFDPRKLPGDHKAPPHKIPHSDDPADVRKTHIIWE